jgi:hypothetical protein
MLAQPSPGQQEPQGISQSLTAPGDRQFGTYVLRIVFHGNGASSVKWKENRRVLRCTLNAENNQTGDGIRQAGIQVLFHGK